MAQYLRTLVTALPEAPSLFPSIHIGWLTVVYDYSSIGNDTLFWPPCATVLKYTTESKQKHQLIR